MRLTLTAALGFGVAGFVRGGILVQFRTPLGDMEVEMYEIDKPVTVQNFVNYVDSGRFQDTFVQRWEPNFVIQGGGYFVRNRGTTNEDFALVPTLGQITNEYSVGRTFSNTYGTIAMARVGGQTNSATSQWFFNLTNNAFLDRVDGGFTVFGRVLRGTNVLERFRSTAATNGVFRVNAGGALNTLPVLKQQPTFDDLVYTAISVLRVQVARNPDGSRAVSWNSISNAPNRVEFTTEFPARWQTLISTNGTGAPITVSDSSPDPFRTYRVSVDF